MKSIRGRSLLVVGTILLPVGCASMSSTGRDSREIPPSSAGRRPTTVPPGPRPAAGSASDPETVRAAFDSPGPPAMPDPGATGALGLDEAKSLAVRLNPQVAQDRAAVERAEGGEEVAYSGYLP